MLEASDRHSVTNLSKVTWADDFINLRRWAKAFFWQQYVDLLGRAKALWEELDDVYEILNTQIVFNIECEIETMTSDKDEE